MYNPYTAGKYVYLRHPSQEDVEGRWHEWLSDEDTTKYLDERYWPNSLEAQRDFAESGLRGQNRLLLSIVDVESDKHIGVCNLSLINWVHRFCHLSLIIGEKEFRKGPYAFETCSLLLKTAFLRLNMHTVRAGYASCNEFSEKLLEVLRFKETGRYPEAFWIDGRWVDCVNAQIKQSDWLKANGYPSS